MHSAIDTNILIGLINPKDRLHKMSDSFCHAKSIFILQSVITETKVLFLKKYNVALNHIQEESEKNKEINQALIQSLENESDKKNYSNFHRLILAEFEKMQDIPTAEKFFRLRKGALKWLNSFLPVLRKKFRNWKESERLSDDEIKVIEEFERDLLGKVSLYNQYDTKIFVEFFAEAEEYQLKDFYSNDDRFIKKANTLRKELALPDMPFYFIEPQEKAPYYSTKSD